MSIWFYLVVLVNLQRKALGRSCMFATHVSEDVLQFEVIVISLNQSNLFVWH